MGSIKPTYYPDRHCLCRKVERKGKSPLIDVFQDRRAGLTFPSVNNPGYFCIFGLQQVITHRDKRPLELLAEGSFEDQAQLFASLTRHMRMMQCTHVYADCSKTFQSNEVEFEKYIRRNGVHNIGLFDASEFEGFESSYAGFEAARAPMDEHGKKGLLKIHTKSQLRGELRVIDADDFTSSKPWEKYPAVNAFNHIIMSYVISPWVKPDKEYFNQQREGYGG